MTTPELQDNAKPKASPRLLLIVLFAVGIPLAVVLSRQVLSRTEGNRDPFIEAQRSVMRSEFQSEIELLDMAPRYQLEASIDPSSGSYTGKVDILYWNSGEACLPQIGLRLYANADSMYGGQLEVEQAAVDGQSATIQQVNPTELSIPLSECLPAGADLSLHVQFAGKLPATGQAGYGILATNQRGLALTGWYPMLSFPVEGSQLKDIPVVGDLLHAEISLVEARLLLPAGYQVVSSGKATITSTDEQVEWRVLSGPTRELAVLLLDDPQPISRQVDGVELRFFPSEAASNINDPAPSEMAAAIFQHFQQAYGPYPFSELDIAEWPVTIGGYEFSGLVFIDQGMRAAGNEADFEFLLAHELAHQWWFLLVGNDQVNEPWLDEALANYSVVRYLSSLEGNQDEALVQRWRQQYGLPQPGDPPIDTPATRFAGWDAYRRTVYIHGALFLQALEQEIGEDEFDRLLDRHLERNRYDMATTQSFLEAAQAATDQDLGPFFDRWLSPQAISNNGD